MAFQPFGNRKKQLATDLDPNTDLEMLDDYGLIHMNGRVYDPQIGRFLSADPFVQAPENSQSYNRYSYVWNNPLSAIDPNGYETVGFRVGANGEMVYTLGGDNPFSYFPKSVERLMPVVRDIVTSVSGLQNRKALIQNLGTSLNTSDRLDFKALWNIYEREFHSPEERALYNTDISSYSVSSGNQSFFISNGDQRSFVERYDGINIVEAAGVSISVVENYKGSDGRYGNIYNVGASVYEAYTSDLEGAEYLREVVASGIGTGVGMYTKTWCIGCDTLAADTWRVINTYEPDINSQVLSQDIQPLSDFDLSEISYGY